jgi:hypothetical protein
MLLERMVESDRIIMFRVAWIDDKDKHKWTEDTVFKWTRLSDLTKVDFVFTHL